MDTIHLNSLSLQGLVILSDQTTNPMSLSHQPDPAAKERKANEQPQLTTNISDQGNSCPDVILCVNIQMKLICPISLRPIKQINSKFQYNCIINVITVQNLTLWENFLFNPKFAPTHSKNDVSLHVRGKY